MKSFFFVSCIFLLPSLSCQTPANPSLTNPGVNNEAPTSIVEVPTLAPKNLPTVTPTATVLFEDDFSNPFSNWSTGEDASARLAIEAGTFHIQVNAAEHLAWTTPSVIFSDVHIEVDTEKLAGPDQAQYGLICRYDKANGVYNFYYFVIAGDTYAAIIKVVDGEQQEISARDLTFDAIRGGNASNHVVAECVGNRLSLYANGRELFTVTDDSHTRGDVGLIIATYEEGGVDVRFDNFVVTAP
jgi:hypothetical protein